MPRYYFDVLDDRLYRDEDGIEFPDLAAVRAETLRSLPEMVQRVVSVDDWREMTVTVRDDAGRPIFEATLTIKALLLENGA